MSDGPALLRAILMNPHDDTVRLVYADWLDENDQGEVATTLRWFMAHPDYHQSVPITCFVPSLKGYDLSGEVCGVWHRGFGSEIRLPASEFLTHAAAIFATHPITRVVLTNAEPWENDIADPPYWRWHTDRRSTVASRADFYMGELPLCLIKHVRRDRRHARVDIDTGKASHCVLKSFDTEAGAMAALEDAAVAYGRELAGLPPLAVRTVPS